MISFTAPHAEAMIGITGDIPDPGLGEVALSVRLIFDLISEEESGWAGWVCIRTAPQRT